MGCSQQKGGELSTERGELSTERVKSLGAINDYVRQARLLMQSALLITPEPGPIDYASIGHAASSLVQTQFNEIGRRSQTHATLGEGCK